MCSSVFANEYLEEWSKFTGGILSGFVCHELGHQIIASSTNTDLSWNSFEWTAKGTNTDVRNVALGGTIAEVTSTELILNSKANKGNSYFLGWLAFNVLNSAGYAIIDVFNGGYGDLETIRKHENGLKVEYVIAFKIFYSLFTGYRLLNNEDFQKSKIKFYMTPVQNGAMAGAYIDF